MHEKIDDSFYSNQTGWLIETARQTYWDGRNAANPHFTPDALDALRFARFQDAEIVRCWLLEPPSKPQTLRSVEHIFGLATHTSGMRHD